MALVVETGTGSATAESFASVADADAYHTKFGNAGWAGTTGEKEIALRRATRFIESSYSTRWTGERRTSAQALSWPRRWADTFDGFAINTDVVPVQVRDAVCEIALSALAGDVLTDQLPDTSGSVVSESVSVGPISVSTTYAGGGVVRKAVLTKSSAILSDLLAGGRVRRG
jgi:hypothetical protein